MSCHASTFTSTANLGMPGTMQVPIGFLNATLLKTLELMLADCSLVLRAARADAFWPYLGFFDTNYCSSHLLPAQY